MSKEPMVVPAASDIVPPVAGDRAQVVFLDPAKLQVGWAVGIYDVTGKDTVLLGMTGLESRSVQSVTPGHHLFMSSTGNSVGDILAADLEAGKRYYVLVRMTNPLSGATQLRPFRRLGERGHTSLENPQFAEWVAKSHVVVDGPSVREWVETYRDAIEESRVGAFAAWNRRTDAQRAELTLRPEDAVSD